VQRVVVVGKKSCGGSSGGSSEALKIKEKKIHSAGRM
jgi:hypothetical protein